MASGYELRRYERPGGFGEAAPPLDAALEAFNFSFSLVGGGEQIQAPDWWLQTS